jgi:hypothetical protein
MVPQHPPADERGAMSGRQTWAHREANTPSISDIRRVSRVDGRLGRERRQSGV